MINGIIPKNEKITHTIAVSRNPSRFPISDRRGRDRKVMALPVTAVTATPMPNAAASSSP